MKLLRSRLLFVGVIGLAVGIIAVGCTKGNDEAEAPSASVIATQSVSPSPTSELESVPTASSAPSRETPATVVPTETPNATPSPSSNVEPESNEPTTSPTLSPLASPTDTLKSKEIEQKYESKFSSIRSSCQAKVSNLTGEVTSYIAGAKSGDGEVSIADLQKKFLGKVAAAEASCDKQFNRTLAQAEQAYKDVGIVDTKLSTWKSQYDNGKAQARLSAMSKILGAWQAE